MGAFAVLCAGARARRRRRGADRLGVVRRLKRVALVAVLFAAAWAPAAAQDLYFSDAEADCAAKLIFMNECSGKEKHLLFWSVAEGFPSLGIGHFIWYPADRVGPYQESFPAFLDFAQELGLEPPRWVRELPGGRAPWRDRAEFLADLESTRVVELRRFLSETKRAQAHYILHRFQKVFPRIVDDLDEADRAGALAKYELLMSRPRWAFAMIDYVNFKGEGFRSDARYGGVGWGLGQVLVEMRLPDDPDRGLDAFIEAAERVLERRVHRSPRPEVEVQWLPGWRNRVRGYRGIAC